MRVIDSHTEGEPTRVVVEGGPDLGGGPLSQRLERFGAEFDAIRRTVILEPRGSDALVGALLCEPTTPEATAGVIFFNNAGYLGMCGHGAIGVAVTLAYLKRISVGDCRLETPVGVVQADLKSPNEVTIENVPSYRYAADVEVDVDGLGPVTGDVAWGGNWFFLVNDAPAELTLSNVRSLTDAALRVRESLRASGVTGKDGAEIDHIEFFGPPASPNANSRNFVLCPGGAYDRSPCGTGTSAKLACLAASGKLKPDQTWVQESVIGSRFQASYRWDDKGLVLPSITGRAYIVSESRLIQQELDPFRNGIT